MLQKYLTTTKKAIRYGVFYDHGRIFFLQILSDFLHNRPTQPLSASLDWGKISQLAKAQQVEGILFTQCQSFIPPLHFSRLAQGYSKTLFYYANRAALLDEITDVMKDESIPYFLVKGFTIAKLYPTPALRTMGDIDFVVHKDDKERVHAILFKIYPLTIPDSIKYM